VDDDVGIARGDELRHHVAHLRARRRQPAVEDVGVGEGLPGERGLPLVEQVVAGEQERGHDEDDGHEQRDAREAEDDPRPQAASRPEPTRPEREPHCGSSR
jgi:hypothetical protein